jgi:WD40 repeat protein
MRTNTVTLPEFFFRLTIVLVAAFALTQMGFVSMSSGRLQRCVLITRTNYLLDMAHWVIGSTDARILRTSLPSPDGASEADLTAPSTMSLTDELVVRSAGGEHTLTSMTFSRVAWTHAGDRLFYLRSDDNKTVILGSVNRDGTILGEVPLSISTYIDKLEVSADDRLVAVTSSPLMAYSADTLQPVAQILPAMSQGVFLWSPVGHTALVARDQRLLVWSPEKGNILDLSLTPLIVSWSPDGQAVALLVGASESGGPTLPYAMRVYTMDGLVARELFRTEGTALHGLSDDRPRFVWLDSHRLALWQPTADGTYSLAHYDLDTDQFTTIVEGASEPGVFTQDRHYALYRLASGSSFELRIAPFSGGEAILLAGSFGSSQSTYTLLWSPDFSYFLLEAHDTPDSDSGMMVWSRSDGAVHGTLRLTPLYEWVGSSTLAYVGQASDGAYAGLIDLQTGANTVALNAMEKILLIPVEHAEPYMAFYWQKHNSSEAGFDVYTPDRQRLYSLPSDLKIYQLLGPYTQPALFLSPDAEIVIPRAMEQRLQGFEDGGLAYQKATGNPEDVLWLPDSSGALLLTNDPGYSTIWLIDRAGNIQRTLQAPYLSRSMHQDYGLAWSGCA